MPVITGLLIQHFAPRLAEVIGKPVRMLANILFIVLFVVLIILLVLSPDLRMMLNLGGLATAAIIIMVGSLLGHRPPIGRPIPGAAFGPRYRQHRAECRTRPVHRRRSDNGQNFIPTLLTYMILGALLGVAYSVWSKRQMYVGRKTDEIKTTTA